MQRTQANIRAAEMYDAPIAAIVAGGSDPTLGKIMSTEGLDFVTVELEFTGAAAGSAGTVTFNLASSTDYDWNKGVGNFSTETEPIVGTLNGASKVRTKAKMIDCRGGVRAIRMTGITNGDAAQAVNALSAYMSACQ